MNFGGWFEEGLVGRLLFLNGLGEQGQPHFFVPLQNVVSSLNPYTVSEVDIIVSI